MLFHQQFENCMFVVLQEQILSQTEQKARFFFVREKIRGLPRIKKRRSLKEPLKIAVRWVAAQDVEASPHPK